MLTDLVQIRRLVEAEETENLHLFGDFFVKKALGEQLKRLAFPLRQRFEFAVSLVQGLEVGSHFCGHTRR